MIKVPLYRRIVAVLLDGIFAYVGAVLFYDFLFKVSGNFEIEYSTYLVLSVIILSPFIAIDQIFLPTHTGYTTSRWLCNYKILDLTKSSSECGSLRMS